MRANIYIRKENEEVWDNLVDKSDWVNWHLAAKRTKGATKKNRGAAPDIKIEHTPKDTNPFVGLAKDLCKHGAHPKLCKHAKPGKECK